MKRIILLFTIFLSSAIGLKAQLADGKIKIEKLAITEQQEQVTVSFIAVIDTKAVPRKHTFIFVPVLTDGQYTVGMPPVIIEGKGTKNTQARREWVAGETHDYDNPILALNGQRVSYTATIESQEWMEGANLRVESVLGGCCTYNRQGDLLLASNIDLSRRQPVPELEPVSQPEVWEPVTVADHLSTAFTFVVPETEYDPEEPFKIYEDERESSLVVYYRVGKYDIQPDYMDNHQTLDNLTAAINMILNSTDSQVSRIVVAGFASPEGSLELNDRLAFERAVSVKKYIMESCSIHDNMISVYNGSVDWRGLRSMVMKSNMPEKKEIVNIIDNIPVWDSQRKIGRLDELKKFNGGSTYQALLRDIFPYLRNGAFIKVYYGNE